MEKLYPNFLPRVLKSQEHRIIVVTGTNGKTTTTKMLVEGLRGAGLTVVTNATGSNMTRGLIAALIEDMTYLGNLKQTDWFVFEMDEAYGPIFTQKIAPHLVVGLNVLRDQLDRYGEIDNTARLIQQTASKAQYFIYSALDPLLSKAANTLTEQGVNILSFGVKNELLKQVANEQTLHGQVIDSAAISAPTVCLESAHQEGAGQKLKIQVGQQSYTVNIPLSGFHNALNTLAVVGVLDSVVESRDLKKCLQAIAQMPVPFGRGEQLHLKDKVITVALVKNPSGFANNLDTFVQHMKPDAVLFVVNDNFADGRDVSWLWDVTFQGVVDSRIPLYTSGIRAYDMALRLKHDNLDSQNYPSVTEAVKAIMGKKYKNIVIIPTYTALFEVRAALGKYGKVPRIW